MWFLMSLPVLFSSDFSFVFSSCLQDLHTKLLIKTYLHYIPQLSGISIVSSVLPICHLPICWLGGISTTQACQFCNLWVRLEALAARFWGLGINRIRETVGNLPPFTMWLLPCKTKSFRASILWHIIRHKLWLKYILIVFTRICGIYRDSRQKNYLTYFWEQWGWVLFFIIKNSFFPLT